VDPLLAVIGVIGRASSSRELGKETEALKLLNDAVARADALGGANGSRDVRHLANKARLDRAVAWSRIDAKKADAQTELDQVVERGTKLVDDFPHAAIYRELVARALIERGSVYTGSKPELAAT